MEKLQFFGFRERHRMKNYTLYFKKAYFAKSELYRNFMSGEKTGDKMRENKRSADFIAFKIVHKLLRCIWIASKKLSIFFRRFGFVSSDAHGKLICLFRSLIARNYSHKSN